jgi:hypothetical protein
MLLAPIVGAAQFGFFWLVRHSSVKWMQWTFCAASALLLIPYQRFLASTDLTTNSTAPLAAMFFPLYLALLSLPAAWLGWGVVGKLAGRRQSE